MVSRGSSPKGALICVILSHSLKFRNQETVLEKLLSYSWIFGTQALNKVS